MHTIPGNARQNTRMFKLIYETEALLLVFRDYLCNVFLSFTNFGGKYVRNNTVLRNSCESVKERSRVAASISNKLYVLVNSELEIVPCWWRRARSLCR